VAPYCPANSKSNASDLTAVMRLALDLEETRPPELVHCDPGTPDDIINARDISLFIPILLSR
jgi:hypothetical protein